MKKKQLIHSEGATFSGVSFWLGLITILFAIYSLSQNQNILHSTFASVALIVGIIPLLAIKAVRFDFDQKIAYKYLDLILIKITYEKVDLQYFDAVELRLFSENQGMNMRSISTTVRTRVYELYLKSAEKPKLLIIESTDYSKAREIMKALSKGLNISSENKYEEWMQRVKENRRIRDLPKN